MYESLLEDSDLVNTEPNLEDTGSSKSSMQNHHFFKKVIKLTTERFL